MQDVLSSLFNIGPITNITAVTEGVLSTNNVFDADGSKYFLKNYKSMALNNIQHVHKAMDFFKINGLPVTMPIKTVKGDTVFFFNEDYYALFPYVDALKVYKNSATPEQAKELGTILAKMHKLSEKGIPHGFDAVIKKEKPLTERIDKITKIKKLIQEKPTLTTFDNTVLASLAIKEKLLVEQWDHYSSIDLAKDTLIHGDFHIENVFFNNSSQIIDIFDFDKVKIQYREAEILWCLLLSFCEKSFIQNVDQIGNFLKAYNELFKIDHARISNAVKLYYFGIFRSIWAEEEYYLKNNTRVAFIIETDLMRIEYLAKNIEEYIKFLLGFL